LTAPLQVDEELIERGNAAPRQAEHIRAIIQHGSAMKAAEALGVDLSNICRSVKLVRQRAARNGYAPGHWDSGVPEGYRLGLVTRERRHEDGTRSWQRLSPADQTLEDLIARCEERLQDFPRLGPLPAPEPVEAPLTNFLGLFDLHIGEKISSDDPAGRWDINIAKKTILASVAHAIRVAPKARRLVLCFGGDAIHYDGLLPVTPKSRHVLHSDGDFDDMADAALDVATGCIDEGLRTHEEVYLIWAEGNHDEASSVWMRKMLARIYSAEPRLTVVQSKVPWYALQFGRVMIGVHHGHKAKLKRYPGTFANMFRQMWGATTYAYGHRGHEHHIHEKEEDGMIATQHPSLAPSDDYAAGMGLISRRGCMMITYHDDFGEVGRNTTRPEMLGLLEPEALAA
jgi:hypothetical protein